MDILKLEYTENSLNVRQINTRIWAVYDFYLALVAGAFALVFKADQPLNHYRLILTSI